MSEPDYTEIRDSRIRGKICELMSEMLDNPDDHDILPTSRFMWKMETFILAEIERLQEELAWCHEGLTRAHEVINPDMPAPDWATVYASLEDAKKARDGDD